MALESYRDGSSKIKFSGVESHLILFMNIYDSFSDENTQITIASDRQEITRILYTDQEKKCSITYQQETMRVCGFCLFRCLSLVVLLYFFWGGGGLFVVVFFFLFLVVLFVCCFLLLLLLFFFLFLFFFVFFKSFRCV